MSGQQDVVVGFDPRTGVAAEGVPATKPAALDRLVAAAAGAFEPWTAWSPSARAEALDAVAGAMDAATDDLVAIADSETGLGEVRLRGEVRRTSDQLRLFGTVLRDGSYLGALITPEAEAQPDIRRMLEPLGPVAVFAASNFPFAFSIAGGDTASALAAGCPVVVKAHEGHPRTSAATERVVLAALTEAGAPHGVFAVAYGRAAGPLLVEDARVRAVGFTGSRRGGRALFDLACARAEPIPFYGELGSVNPVVVLPAAAASRGDEIARGYVGSLLLGVGQFCTNPGLLFVPRAGPLVGLIRDELRGAGGGVMLSAGMRDAYVARTAAVTRTLGPARLLARSDHGAVEGWWVEPVVAEVPIAQFQADLAEECFGPFGLIVTYDDVAEARDAIAALDANLTASVHAEPEDHPAAADLALVLRRKAGRLIFNGWPTGVSVCWAMHHGGPWPATTAARWTSVGAGAIGRWLAPVAYQSWPDELLPPALQHANPMRIARRVDGAWEPTG